MMMNKKEDMVLVQQETQQMDQKSLKKYICVYCQIYIKTEIENLCY